MKSDQMLALYKTAASGMVKKALDFDSLSEKFNTLNPGAKAAIVSALGGAGVGLLSHALTPKDDDEDTRGRLLSNILTGAALGGLAGYGGHTLYNAVRNGGLAPFVQKQEPGWYQRNAPEVGYSDMAIAGGLGAGALAGGAKLNALRGTKGLELLGQKSSAGEGAIRSILNTATGRLNERAVFRDNDLLAAWQAYENAQHTGIVNKLLQLIPDWKKLPQGWRNAGNMARGHQARLDSELLTRLQAATKNGTRATGAAADQLIGSTLANPRKVMNALRSPGLPKGRLAALAAALLLAGGGYKMYQTGQRHSR
jgi:hypothetical protein